MLPVFEAGEPAQLIRPISEFPGFAECDVLGQRRPVLNSVPGVCDHGLRNVDAWCSPEYSIQAAQFRTAANPGEPPIEVVCC